MKNLCTLFASMVLVGLFVLGCASVDNMSAPAGSDEALADAVLDRIQRDDFIAHEPVSISAENGVVTVRGFTSTPALKSRVLSAVNGTAGVVEVVDDLR